VANNHAGRDSRKRVPTAFLFVARRNEEKGRTPCNNTSAIGARAHCRSHEKAGIALITSGRIAYAYSARFIAFRDLADGYPRARAIGSRLFKIRTATSGLENRVDPDD